MPTDRKAPGHSEERRAALRRALLVWALLSVFSLLPYVRAHVAPPSGGAFVGFFYYIDDAYNYLSYVEQAERGAKTFENKLVLEAHQPMLVNLEWYLVGRLSALLGGRPFLAYLLYGWLACLALVLAVEAWLARLVVPVSHRLPALLLVMTAAGLGGVRFLALQHPLPRCLDLLTGMFPIIETLGNPHFTGATALFAWALLALTKTPSRSRAAAGVALGTALGAVRPYDFFLLLAIVGLVVVLCEPPRTWLRLSLPLLGLLPIAMYNVWVFYMNHAFSQLSSMEYERPAFLDFVTALGPAILLAILALFKDGYRLSGEVALDSSRSRPTGRALPLVIWAASVTAVLIVWPVHFSLQFSVGVGVPLLIVGALGLARYRPCVTLVVNLALSVTGAAALTFVLSRNSSWFVPRERMDIAWRMRELCRPGELVLAPPDIGLYVSGLSACKAFVSHAAVPNFLERMHIARWFFTNADHESRSRFLDATGISYVTLSAADGSAAQELLGEGTPFHEVAAVGQGSRRIGIFARLPAPVGRSSSSHNRLKRLLGNETTEQGL
ncbi:MAG: hypothetical protein JXO72_16685 [Vicinamibacteria bacterium]|nr:hypothetical protein [Vicinamibacteria bacterium]